MGPNRFKMMLIALLIAVAAAQDWVAPSTAFKNALAKDSSAYLKDGNNVLYSPICGYDSYFEPQLGRCRHVKTGRFVAGADICASHSKYDRRVRRCRHKENGRFTSRRFGPCRGPPAFQLVPRYGRQGRRPRQRFQQL